mmetsp:Transcript_4976/g.18024  ORF Transcript_4976/g.18024 Transcript_4976/m.18024 type:complete len:332 (+) Transcript_4976:228-1223(+)
MNDLLDEIKVEPREGGGRDDPRSSGATPSSTKKRSKSSKTKTTRVEVEELDELPSLGTTQDEEAHIMNIFFEDVSEIKALLKDLKKRLAGLRALQETTKDVTRGDVMHEKRSEMGDMIKEISKQANKIKNKVQELDASNKEVELNISDANLRTREQVTAALLKKLQSTINDFSRLRTEFEEDYKEVVEQRIYTVTGRGATEEELDRMIETGESEQIFQKAMLEQGRGTMQVMETVEEIRERHEAVMELERGLAELNQMFLDLASLVEHQGDMIDNIGHSVATAKEYTEQGVVALEQAHEYQKSARKKTCCIMMIVLGIGVVIVVVVVILAR